MTHTQLFPWKSMLQNDHYDFQYGNQFYIGIDR